jgi:hypothetical protein
MTSSIVAAVLLVLAVLLLRSAVFHWRQRNRLTATTRGAGSVLFLALALCAAFATIGVLGYRALTHEEIAATVTTQPLGPHRFSATIVLPGQRLAMYELSGDAFYVDAHIVKWHPYANLLGFHTAYELDRVSGRYNNIAEERSQPRTVYSLARAKPVDLFDVARRLKVISPLVDAQYGSASFVEATRPAEFQVRVSTTGLLIRRTK